MAEERQYDNMVGKPLFDILSKLPSKSLLRFRCVSKLWREYIDDSYFVSVHDKQVIEDPTPIMFYEAGFRKPLCFHTIEPDAMTNHVLKAKNLLVPVVDFVGKKLVFRDSRLTFVGSCNGLVLIKTYGRYLSPIFMVIHPMKKQCYVLPQLELDYLLYGESCGFGFDSSTNTFKMVCVFYHKPCTMVHVFGTDSWHKIPRVPAYRILSGEAIFGHGCLHWLADYNGEDCARRVIWFDVKNEEFGLIKPPTTKRKPSKRKYQGHYYDHLVNLDGQVGYIGNKTREVWVLNHKKEWVLYCNLEDHDLPDYYIKVLGCLNKAGDILIKLSNWDTRKEMFYIYNLKNRVIHEANMDALDLEYKCTTEIVLFPNSLQNIITNSNLFKKGD